MQWLTPFVGLLAAAVAVPLLLLLYFLKLKRREAVVSSTLLWKRAVQDLQVNAPFQRLRRNLLLLLQLLALTAMLVALAGPVLSLDRGPGQRYVVLIDRSASMNATDVTPSRLAEAKKQAKVFVESLRSSSAMALADRADHAMVIAFDRHARVMCNFTSDKRQLMVAIDAIEAGDGTSQLSEAVTVARAFAQSPGPDSGPRSDEGLARMVLFSDGRIDDLGAIAVASDELVYHRIGESADNIAITAMKARRSYEQPQQVEVFVSLANYGTQSAARDVQLGIDGDVRAVRSVTIPPRQEGDETQEWTPGKVAVSFSLTHEGQGVVEVRQLEPDALACDDAAWSVLDPPPKLSVLLVTEGNPVLESSLRACPIARLDPCAPAAFDAMEPSAFSLSPYDVIVLDRHAPLHLPRSCYLAFGAVPAGIDVNSPGELENQVIVDWRSRHPVLQYANLTNLFVAQTRALQLPRDAEVLAEFGESPAIALVRRHGSTFLLVGFDVLASNWPFEPSFVLFCYNALSYLAAQQGGGGPHELAVAEPIVIDDVAAGGEVAVTLPDASTVQVAPDPGGTARFPGTYRVGLYAVDVPEEPRRFYAVNLADENESRIEPGDEMTFETMTVSAQPQGVQRANVPLWPALVLTALVLACVEWLIYNKKARI
ncbi:MAG: VWA domain-containing protein [Phycisphaerae bacterium]|nr:VWA domain-containing protein [Phycisphaerae bacterium]